MSEPLPASRRAVFAYQILWLCILVFFGIVLFFDMPLRQVLIDKVLTPASDFWLRVAWFGALGAVLISMTGIVTHARDWDDGQILWHVSKPFVGGAFAAVTALIIKAGVTSINGSTSQPTGPILFYIVAFLVGWREETFRDLIKRVVDVILKPGNGAATIPAISGVKTDPSGTPPTVTISGSGFAGTTSVLVGTTVAQFQIVSDSELKVTGSFTGKDPVTVKAKGGTATWTPPP